MSESFVSGTWYWEVVVSCDHSLVDTLSCYLFEEEATGIEEISQSGSITTLKIYFNSDCLRPAEKVEAIAEKVGSWQEFRLLIAEKKPLENWQTNWKVHFRPIKIGNRFVVAPPWDKTTTNRLKIIIQPGFGFGTGYHESTNIALQLLEQVAAIKPLETVLDVGTGSGILAIAALLLNAKTVKAIDIDQDALNEVRVNVELSGLDPENCQVEHNDPAKIIESPWNLVMANIEDHFLIDMADDLLRLTETQGLLLLSGILTERKGDLLKAFGNQVEVIREIALHEWTGFVLMKNRGV